MTSDLPSTVLIVEDEPLIRMHGVDLLESVGLSVIEAGCADQAIELLGQHTVQLLFSDIDMPGSMNGLQLAHHVSSCWPDVRLLLTSGHRHVAKSEMPDDGGFVRKPWNESELLARIASSLAKC